MLLTLPVPSWSSGEARSGCGAECLPPVSGSNHGSGGGGRGVFARFRRGRRGAVGIEAALSLSVLVVSLGVLMGIVETIYVSDRLSRAARAAAYTISMLPPEPAGISPNAVACQAIQRELGLDAEFNCAERWTISVDTYPDPAALLAGAARGGDAPLAGEDGDMILVQIGQDWAPRLFALLSGADNDIPTQVTAVGVARKEQMF